MWRQGNKPCMGVCGEWRGAAEGKQWADRRQNNSEKTDSPQAGHGSMEPGASDDHVKATKGTGEAQAVFERRRVA